MRILTMSMLKLIFLSACIYLCDSSTEVSHVDVFDKSVQVGVRSQLEQAFERLKLEYDAALELHPNNLDELRASRTALDVLHRRILDARDQLILAFPPRDRSANDVVAHDLSSATSIAQIAAAPAQAVHSQLLTKTLALSWLVSISSVPFWYVYIEWTNVTRTQIYTSKLLLFWLWLCVYLFTNVLEFRSSNFPGSRSLSLEEVVYVLAQMVTTVGYGDITPATRCGQLCMASFIIIGLAVCANVIDHVQASVMHQVRDYTRRLEEQIRKRSENTRPLVKAALVRMSTVVLHTDGDGDEAIDMQMHRSLEPFLSAKALSLNYGKLIRAAIAITLLFTLGVLFWTHYPGEERSPFAAVYMCIITFSTVGFGANVAHTPEGYVFAAYWMFLGVAAFLSLMAAIWELICEVRIWEERYSVRKISEFDSLIGKLGLTPDSVMTWEQFLVLALELSQMATERDIAHIRNMFHRLDPDETGTVDVSVVRTEELGHLNTF